MGRLLSSTKPALSGFTHAMNIHEKINYVEFPAGDIAVTKAFFAALFGWTFTDYGPDYTAFSGAGMDGGFFKSDLVASSKKGGALIVFYSEALEHTQSKIENVGGSIIKPIYSFPGGRRFHFGDPSGNEFAVWSDKTP
jgi:predicted enzyme related to lactoylglutathione lyase